MQNNPNHRPSRQGSQPNEAFSTPTEPNPRSFKTPFDPQFLKTYHRGTMAYTYKGVPCLKDPIDFALYTKLIWDYKPRTIVEIGSFEGGAAIYYADLCHSYGLQTDIVTVDFRNIQQQRDTRIKFVLADALNLENSDLHELLNVLPRPWLIIEDSAHTYDVCRATLEYFKDRLEPGEILIIEDGVIEDQGGNRNYGGGPNLAVSRFFVEHPTCFRVMVEYTDFFGMNATFNPNAYLQKL